MVIIPDTALSPVNVKSLLRIKSAYHKCKQQ